MVVNSIEYKLASVKKTAIILVLMTNRSDKQTYYQGRPVLALTNLVNVNNFLDIHFIFKGKSHYFVCHNYTIPYLLYEIYNYVEYFS